MRFGEILVGAVIAAGVVAGGVMLSGKRAPETAAAVPLAAAGSKGDILVYKSPTCGCCSGWTDHMRAAGFNIDVRDTSDVGAVKRRLGVLPTLVSCHTAVVAGYVVEGHVPAADIERMLKERPQIVGLAVAGMPAGSPGMEDAQPHVPYDVIAFDAQGRTEVWAKH